MALACTSSMSRAMSQWSTGLPLSLVKKIPSVSSPLIGDKIPKSEIYKARPYTRAVRGPQSKGMDQWQLTSLAKGEFASKKCSDML
jgi:hypothetical protein